MKYLLLIPFLFSVGTFAQDVEYKYEPVVNKAEYYIGSYKNGKDLDIWSCGITNLLIGLKIRAMYTTI